MPRSSSLYSLLRALKKRPGMYLGEDVGARGLRIFLTGWQAHRALGAREPDQVADLLQDGGFHGFVANRLARHPELGWDRVLVEVYPDGQAQVAAFFELLEEWLETQGIAPQGDDPI